MINNEIMEIPFGFCHCGCGNKTSIATRSYNHQKVKVAKGGPYKFLSGHCNRVNASIRPEFEIDKNGCWIWKRSKGKNGYGRLNRKDGSREAHRYFYEKYKGAIPDGLQIDHLCRTPLCVNPDHLEIVTQTENVRRGKCAKLNMEEVNQIIKIHKENESLSQEKIGKIFGITQSNVSRILREVSWQ